NSHLSLTTSYASHTPVAHFNMYHGRILSPAFDRCDRQQPAPIMDHRPDNREGDVDVEYEAIALGAFKAIDGRQRPARQRQAQQLPLDQRPGEPVGGWRQAVMELERKEAFHQQAVPAAVCRGEAAGVAAPGKAPLPILAA